MDISPLLSNVIRYIVGLSIIYIGMSLFRYFLEPESFYIERFRKKSAHTTHRALLVRAFVGLGLIFPIIVTLGMIIIGWELFHPKVWLFLVWLFVLISLGLGTGVGSYAYFRLFKYQKLNVEESEYKGVEVNKVFVNRESLSSGVTLLHPRVVRFLVWAVIIGSLLALFIHPAITN